MEEKLNDKHTLTKNEKKYQELLKESCVAIINSSFDEALNGIDEAINIFDNRYEAYYQKGLLYYKYSNFKEAEEYIEKANSLGCDDLEYYSLKSYIYYSSKDYTNALNYVNKYLNSSEDLESPETIPLYCIKSLIYSELKQYEEAIMYIKQAEVAFLRFEKEGPEQSKQKNDVMNMPFISYLKAVIYNIWGDIYLKKSKFKNALAKYNESIDPKYENSSAYLSIGNTYYIRASKKNDKKLFNKALSNYRKALDLKKSMDHAQNYSAICAGLGNVNMELGNTKEASKNYRLASESYTLPYTSDQQTNMLLEITEYYINNLKCSEEISNLIIEHSLKLAYATMKFKNKKLVNFKDVKKFVHYTTPPTIENLIPNEGISKGHNVINSYFRLYNAMYMNDPEEGILLIDALKQKYKKLFNSENDGYNPQATFIGSFLKEEDELFLWRTYGKDENEKEARGLNLVFNQDYFDQDNTSYLESSKIICDLIGKNNVDREDNVEKSELCSIIFNSQHIKYNLYHVTYVIDKDLKKYINPRNNKNNKTTKDKKLEDLADYLKNIQGPLSELKELCFPDNRITSDLKKEEIKIVSDMTLSILKDVSYLIKSKSYKEEQEMRVLVTLPIDDKEHIKFDPQDTYPQKMYINIEKSLNDENGKYDRYIKKVTLGPNLKDKNRWIAYLNRKGLKVKESTHKIQ